MLKLCVFGILSLAWVVSADIPAPPNALTYDDVRGKAYNVTYDSRSFIIDGKRSLLLGGAVHYPRIEPQRWHSVLQQMRDAGMNHVQIYTFWNLHEPAFDGITHSYDFHSPRSNLRSFLKAAQDVGIFVNVRVGPYVCAEWNLGGLPLWLTRVPGIRFRAMNEQWQAAVSVFVTRVMQEVEPFLSKNGGPVILGQIENELGSYGGAASQEYADWCGDFVQSLDTQMPWVMCNGLSARNTVNTCNSNDCENYYSDRHSVLHPDQPMAWTEDEQWFESWGKVYDPVPLPGQSVGNMNSFTRLPHELADSIARWFAVGASHHVYYMWEGGNHIARWAGASVTNIAPMHSDGLPNEPKRSHMSNLHHTLSALNAILLSQSPQVHRAYAVAVFDGKEFILPRDFRSGLTSCDSKSTPQLWSYSSSSSSSSSSSFKSYPPQHATQLFFHDVASNASFCLSAADEKQPVGVAACDPSGPPSQSWQIQQGKGPGVKFTIASVAYPSTCLALNLDSNGNFLSSSLLLLSCDFYDSGLAVSWNLDAQSQPTLISNSFAQSSCLSAIENATVSAFTYGSGSDTASFIVNRDANSSADILWSNRVRYTIAAAATLILDGAGAVLFDSSNVSAAPVERTYTPVVGSDMLTWKCWSENLTETNQRQQFRYPALSPLEQLNVTNDQTDYLLYSTYVVKLPPTTSITFDGWRSNVYIVLVDGEVVLSTFEASHDYDIGNYTYTMQLGKTLSGTFMLQILSVSLGLHNSVNVGRLGSEQESKGIVGSVSLGSVDITNNGWNMLPYLNGELKQVYSDHGQYLVSWKQCPSGSRIAPVTWTETEFSLTQADVHGTLVLDIGSSNANMRGHFYLNGVDLGRVWGIAQGGAPVQQYYYLPLDVVRSHQNRLTFVLEQGGSLEDLQIMRVSLPA